MVSLRLSRPSLKVSVCLSGRLPLSVPLVAVVFSFCFVSLPALLSCSELRADQPPPLPLPHRHNSSTAQHAHFARTSQHTSTSGKGSDGHAQAPARASVAGWWWAAAAIPPLCPSCRARRSSARTVRHYDDPSLTASLPCPCTASVCTRQPPSSTRHSTPLPSPLCPHGRRPFLPPLSP